MKKIRYLLLPTLVFLAITTNTHAQELGIGVAKYMTIDEEVEDGDIVSIQQNEFLKSSRFYDPSVVGIVVENPAISINLQPVQGENEAAVIDSGEASVKVSTVNGNIVTGDILTTSETPGVAAKATRPGFAIGIAKEGYEGEEVGKIKVDIQLHYTYSAASERVGGLQESVSNILALNRIATYESPATVLQYSVSGIILLISIVFGFFTFSRAAAKGIEATGRNPMASRVIAFSVVVNVAVTIIIVVAALALAYFIITL